MLRSVKDILGYTILASDGDVGQAQDLLCDDATWAARYLVVDTGNWLPGKRVLVSPRFIGGPRWSDRTFDVNLTREEVERSPSIESDRPVSERRRLELEKNYLWVGPFSGGAMAVGAPDFAEEDGDPHLRSAREVMGYRVSATDGEIGHIEDFVVDTDDWVFRYMVIDTRNWLPGKKVLQAIDWLDSVDWESRTATVELSRAAIQESESFDPRAPINRELETRLYDFYGRPYYW